MTFPGADLDACVPVAMPGTASNNGFFSDTQITAKIGSWPNVGESSSLAKVYPTTGSTGVAKNAAFQLAVFC